MSLKEVCSGLPEWAHYIIFACLFIWEFWLGKTSKVKAGSSVELLMNFFKGEKNMVLEGKELEGQFDAGAGSYSVDVDITGKIVISIGYQKEVAAGLKAVSSTSVEADLILLLKGLEPKINNPIFTGAIETIAKALGR